MNTTKELESFVADSEKTLILKKFTEKDCEKNPCLNGGKCIPGKYSCECTLGWMGTHCHRYCRDIYKSCQRWKDEGQCNLRRTQTNFFSLNCAVSCHKCIPNTTHELSEIPVPPALEPLFFMTGVWRTITVGYDRYPTDMNNYKHEEILDIMPAEVPMFGAPSFNYTSTATAPNDTRIFHGFITVKMNSNPIEIAILSSSNEGINMVELGTLMPDGSAKFNMTYVQVHPSATNLILPLGSYLRILLSLSQILQATRSFRKADQNLELSVTKLLPNDKIVQFKKTFQKVKDYPL
uniref:Protein male abnormal 7 n=1 Tax=Syphacia muris TaxID=451379 RepID=A0A0N5ADD7_9BILA